MDKHMVGGTVFHKHNFYFLMLFLSTADFFQNLLFQKFF